MIDTVYLSGVETVNIKIDMGLENIFGGICVLIFIWFMYKMMSNL